MALTLPEFTAWWEVMNAEFPTYKQSADDLAVVANEWYRDLRFQNVTALGEASRLWRRENAKRPHLSDIIKLCGTVHFREQAKAARNNEWADTNKCPCGCGGVRWALYLPHFELTRDKLSCLTKRIELLPLLGAEYIGNDTRGVPVWRYVSDAPIPLLTA